MQSASKNKKMYEILSLVKLGSLVVIGILFLKQSINYDENIFSNTYITLNFLLKLLLAVFLGSSYYLWTIVLMKKINPKYFNIICIVESIFFLILFMVFILLTGKHLSPYKILFLFILVPISIQFKLKYGIIAACISALFLLTIDLIYGSNQPININFEIDLVISSIFITISWILSYYVKLEKEHAKMLEDKANMDNLTGLFNHRYFFDQLEYIVETNETNSLSIIFFDLDYFKEYNDMYGHMIGDNVLKIVGKTIKEIVDGQKHIISRYGGDEFAIIINNKTDNEVFEIGEKIRSTIEKLEFTGQERLVSKNLTVSIGIAIYNQDMNNYLELLKCADDALYRAKFINKNRVEVYNPVFSMLKADINEKDFDIITSIKTLIGVINAKDQYTYGHVERVVGYAEMFAEKLELSKEKKKHLIYGAYMHDIGKINISEEALNKKTPLTQEEWNLIKQHPIRGLEIVKQVESLKDISPLVKHHHEKYDGTGYPDKLKGEDIPYLARVLTIVDSFDAMTFGRPYKPAMTFADAINEMHRYSGIQFDPKLTNIFAGIIMDTINNANSNVEYKHNDYLFN